MESALRELIKAVVMIYDEVMELKDPKQLAANKRIEEALLNANKALNGETPW